MTPPKAIIIASGSELLAGLHTDTNTQFLAQSLRRIGIGVMRTLIVGDAYNDLVDTFSYALDRAQIVLISGGLGPTVDDLTREALSEATGIEMVESPYALEEIRERFRSLNREMSENNRCQALVPVSGMYFSNPNGTAPGLVFDAGNRLAIALPGPPRELRPMVENHVIPFLEQKYPGLPKESSVMVRFVGSGESTIDQILREKVPFDPRIRVSLLARLGLVDLTLYCPTSEEADLSLLDESRKRVLAVLGDYAYATEMVDLGEVVASMLLDRGETLATAESCTGGLIGAAITSIPGSSRYYVGGFVTYSNEAKVLQLGVRPETLERHGAVSEETVWEMAMGGARSLKADWCVSVTGIAGPDGGTPEKPVGTVWIGVACPGRNWGSVRRCQFFGDRQAIRERTRVAVFDELHKALRKKEI
ncbi:MAG TPA: competence/damage-inducible protein A [bacterium]|nr:competence/damage-inducible protein A [bacterium]HQO34996.1 competence/damage-inducible protein A [bacterium]HQQ00902.1 competence/damage-inducible protein A [bacterium]